MRGREKIQKIIYSGIILLLVSLVLLYVYKNARPYLSGPSIEIETPKEYQSFDNPLIEVKGNVDYVTELTLNGKIIPITQDGSFFEYTVLQPGYNAIKLDVKDRFGREKSFIREVTLKQKSTLPEAEAFSQGTTTESGF